MDEVKNCWKDQCFEFEAGSSHEWKDVLTKNSIFESDFYGGRINELVNKYGYDYVVKKFNEARAEKIVCATSNSD